MSGDDYVPGYDYVPEGWSRNTPYMTGWSIPERAQEYAANCLQLIRRVNGPATVAEDSILHNIYMSYAYALMSAAGNKKKITILDYGGAVGLYAVLSRSILPHDVEMEYHCKDVPAYKAYAEKMLPWVVYHTDDSRIKELRFDFVLASGVIQCLEDWQGLLRLLASRCGNLLFVTRLSVVLTGDSFVVSQKLPQFVNETLLWCLNRDQFIREAAVNDLSLLREFLLEEDFDVRNAPAPAQYRGYLFRKT